MKISELLTKVALGANDPLVTAKPQWVQNARLGSGADTYQAPAAGPGRPKAQPAAAVTAPQAPQNPIGGALRAGAQWAGNQPAVQDAGNSIAAGGRAAKQFIQAGARQGAAPIAPAVQDVGRQTGYGVAAAGGGAGHGVEAMGQGVAKGLPAVGKGLNQAGQRVGGWTDLIGQRAGGMMRQGLERAGSWIGSAIPPPPAQPAPVSPAQAAPPVAPKPPPAAPAQPKTAAEKKHPSVGKLLAVGLGGAALGAGAMYGAPMIKRKMQELAEKQKAFDAADAGGALLNPLRADPNLTNPDGAAMREKLLSYGLGKKQIFN